MKNTVFLANVAALALLGVVAAYWSWAWLAPRPAPRAPAAAQAAGDTSSAGALFGAPTGEARAAAPGALRLTGVVAASGARRGHALLRLESKRTIAVLQGEEVEPGLRLAEVHAGHVVLERDGARETLALPEKSPR